MQGEKRAISRNPAAVMSAAVGVGADMRRLAQEERADFAAFLATLTPEQWQALTLCARWRVRDVVAHVISYDGLDTRRLLALAARGRFQLGRINAAALARYDTSSPEQLLALLADHLQPRGLPAALGGRVALAETLIHHQDIRRALGRHLPFRPRPAVPQGSALRRPRLCARCLAGRRVAGVRRGVAGCLADAAADGAGGGLDGDDAVDHHGAGEPAGGDVRVVVADGGAAVGADGDGIDVVAERCAVKAVHGGASSAG